MGFFISGSLDGKNLRTFTLTLTIPPKEKKGKPGVRKVYRNPVILAEEFAAKISNGECKSEADLARQLGRSRVYVNHFMHLLTLEKIILEVIKQLGDPLKRPLVTERMLRPYVGQPFSNQMNILGRLAKKQRRHLRDVV